MSRICKGILFIAFASMSCSTEADKGDDVGSGAGETSILPSGGSSSSDAGTGAEVDGGTGGDQQAGGGNGGVGGAADSCAIAPVDPCPTDYQLYSASEWNSEAGCFEEATPFVCSMGASAAPSCLIEKSTGRMFVLDAGPCPPSDDYRACTADEFEVADVTYCE
jgi:hypothetical protein